MASSGRRNASASSSGRVTKICIIQPVAFSVAPPRDKISSAALTPILTASRGRPHPDHDAAYVFGNSRPKNSENDGAGIDVSPAVRDFLGMSSGRKCDWRFVDLNEVPDGPWRNLGGNNHFVQNKTKAATQQNEMLASRLEELRRMRDEYFRKNRSSQYLR